MLDSDSDSCYSMLKWNALPRRSSCHRQREWQGATSEETKRHITWNEDITLNKYTPSRQAWYCIPFTYPPKQYGYSKWLQTILRASLVILSVQSDDFVSLLPSKLQPVVWNICLWYLASAARRSPTSPSRRILILLAKLSFLSLHLLMDLYLFFQSQ